MAKLSISGFGKYPKQTTHLHPFKTSVFKETKSLIARGNGKSYGDIAIGENTFSMLKKNKVLDFNEKEGVITCEAGILLSDINLYINAKGYRFYVIPGTEHISLGGAIANDVHGKNYSTRGSFGNYVISFKLLTGSGNIINCSAEENKDYYHNTIGGIGLTGIILEATINLKKQKQNSFKVKISKPSSVPELLSYFENSNKEYQVAWIKSLNRIVFTEGNYTDEKSKENKRIRTIKFHWWGIFTSKIVLNLFEKYNYLRQKEKQLILNEKKFLHPLDHLTGWNNLYKNGFIQMQFVTPKENIENAIKIVFDYCQTKRHTTFITTLKKYDDNKSIGVMSFPKKGYAFSIDIKYKKGLENDLKNIVDQIIDLDGRFNLSKDSFLSGNQLQQSYPNTKRFKSFIQEKGKGKFVSYLSRRVNLHS